jgi:hypothetical protein
MEEQLEEVRILIEVIFKFEGEYTSWEQLQHLEPTPLQGTANEAVEQAIEAELLALIPLINHVQPALMHTVQKLD